jgi:all-trans-8'-apo-beta-carotenal 15,15'-oxygenase
VGHRDDWLCAIDAPVLPLVVSSAHPVIDPERHCLWTVAVNPIDHTLEVVRYDGQGTRVQRWPVGGAAIPQSTHTITQTRDWLIVADCGFRADPAEIFGGERSITTFTDEPVHLIRKEHLEATPSGAAVAATTLRVGPEVMHYYARYDDTDGIRILFAHTRDVDLAYWVRPDDTDALGRPVDPALAGMYNHPMSPGRVAVLELDPTTGTVTDRAAVEDHDAFWVTQLEAMDWSTEGMSRPTVHHQMFTGFRPEVIVERAIAPYEAEGRVDRSRFPATETPSVLASFERDTMKPTAVWQYPLDDYATSPCFVPRHPGADPGRSRYAGSDPGGHDGYVVTFVHNDAGFRVEVFDAAGVDDGPVATLVAPAGRTVPFLLHSAWMPRAVPAPEVDRLRLADELTDDHLAALPADLAATARALRDETT